MEVLELTAVNMIKEDFELSIISKITGLNVAKIEAIRSIVHKK